MVDTVAETPRERMQALLRDLQQPHGDVNDRLGALQRAVLGLFALADLTLPEQYPVAPELNGTVPVDTSAFPNSPATDPMDKPAANTETF